MGTAVFRSQGTYDVAPLWQHCGGRTRELHYTLSYQADTWSTVAPGVWPVCSAKERSGVNFVCCGKPCGITQRSRIHRDVAVAITGSGLPRETHTLGSERDWRLMKR